MKKKILFDNSVLTLLAMLATLLVFMAIVAPQSFYSISNLRSIIYQFPEFGVMAFGVMVCMISGGIDLSLVGIANLSGVVAASIMLKMGGSDLSIALAIMAALCVGIIAGSFNGLLIGGLNLPPMLVTLCGLQLYSGIALAITKGPALNGLPDHYKFIANGTLGQIPFILFVFIFVLLVVSFIMKSTVFGRQVYFMGSNGTAAHYSGINCLKITIKTYVFSGVLGSVAGVMISSHFNSAKSDYGVTYTLLSILIVVLGGVHPSGGKGKISGVVLAIILLQLITQVFTFLKIDTNFRTFVYGLLLILALVSTMLQDKLTVRRAYRKSKANAPAA